MIQQCPPLLSMGLSHSRLSGNQAFARVCERIRLLRDHACEAAKQAEVTSMEVKQGVGGEGGALS